ncbi:MAG: 4-alpha-glucanotransferase [Gallionellaceae bacterium]|nr:4-alpha-glucanotransferase [Gallionellaceae bacterium]
MTDNLDALCTQAGILPDYYDIWGTRHEASDETRLALLEAMQFPGAEHDGVLPPVVVAWEDQPVTIPVGDGIPADWQLVLEDGQIMASQAKASAIELAAIGLPGYHRLEVSRAGKSIAAMPLIVCPRLSYQPEAAHRKWGLSVQLYGLKAASNWGLGDYTNLTAVVDWAAEAGAGLVGLNPLHALFPHNPRHCSPYSPSSRQFLNVLHIGVASLPEYAECAEAGAQVAEPAFQFRLTELRQAELVDYAGVAALKFAVLETLYRHFRASHLVAGTPRAREFRAFQNQGGEELRQFALYHALQEHFFSQDNALWGWPAWPEAYRRHDSAEVHAFAATHEARVEWHEWLQWLADQQLAAVAERCRAHGLAVGLYQDLAVGVDKGGAETWVHQDLYAIEARVGCPPDDFNPLGQDWGLPPWIPQRLRGAAYEPYIAMLRANMKYAGALRVDHVMGLMRLYWIPPGMKGDAGAYVSYPFQDLLGILNLESQRNQCLIVGEDLGTVPDEVRHTLREAGVMSYKLFYFERQPDGHFFPAEWFPEQSLVAASTHDLPTLAGFWKGRDIETRTALNLYPRPEMREQQIESRSQDRARLLADLAREGLLPEGVAQDPDAVPELTPALLRAIHAHLARSPARLVLVQADDMLGLEDQANQPGTVDEQPNWRRKLALAIEDWPNDERCAAMAATMTADRPAIG